MSKKEVRKEKNLSYKMLSQFCIAAIACILVLLLLSFAAEQVWNHLPFETARQPDEKTREFMEQVDKISVKNGDTSELESLKEEYENMSEEQKYQVSEARYEKIKEALELADRVKESGAHLIVRDKSKNGFDIDFTELETAKVIVKGGRAAFEGQMQVTGEKADAVFNRLFEKTHPFTIEAVMNPNNSDNFNMITSKGDSCTAFRVSEQSIYFFIRKNNGDWCGARQPLDQKQMNSWLHTAGVYDGKNISTYLENYGMATVENVGEVTASQYPFSIGYCPETQRTSVCSIEKLHVYSGAMTESELAAETADPKQDDVALWYDFNDYEYQGMGKAIFEVKGIRSYARRLKLEKGEQADILADLVPYYAKGDLEFKSANAKIASVSENGAVTALQKGQTVITVSVKDSDFSTDIPVRVGKSFFDLREILEYYINNMLLSDVCLFFLFLLILFAVQKRKLLICLGTVADAVDEIGCEKEEKVKLPDELSDIQTVVDQAEERFKEKETEAREAEQRKNDLIVYLAHDLKTPIASVIGYLTLLRDEKQISPELHQHYVETALNGAERLDDLINEFFEITRFTTSHVTLKYQKINLTWMLEQIVSEFKPLLRKKHLTCHLDVPQNVPLWCDPDKMERVFDNLLRNAINYSYPETEISIKVTVAEEIRLVFGNHGRTISKEQLERIFEQFYRLDAERSSSTGGSGLGLAIAREIVELHHGKIWAESKAEEIRFFVCVPSGKSEGES